MGLSAVDLLLLFLLESKRRVAAEMMALGFSEERCATPGVKLEPLAPGQPSP